MSLKDLVAESYAAFNYYSANAQVVMLHPESRLRSMLVAHLLNEEPKPIYYYAIGIDDISISSFLEGFTHDMGTQVPTFGRNLYNQNWRNFDDRNLDVLVQAMVADLNEISDEPFMLILDEFDASNESELIQVFWERVVRYLPQQCQLVLNSRTVPRMPWLSMISSQKAVLLKDTELMEGGFYRRVRTETTTMIDAIGLGPGSVTINDFTIQEWEGHLPRLLLFFVLDRPLVTRTEICRTFWPDLENDQAVNVFHVTKRRLHKALDFDVLVHLDGYYQVNPVADVVYDIEDYVANLIQGRLAETPEEALPYYQAVADAYKGPFLQGHVEPWIVERREDFLAGYLEAMSAIAQVRLNEGRQEQALALLLRAASENDRYEPIHREIMQLYRQLGRRGEAVGHYKKLAAALAEDGLVPSEATEQLYSDIRNG